MLQPGKFFILMAFMTPWSDCYWNLLFPRVTSAVHSGLVPQKCFMCFAFLCNVFVLLENQSSLNWVMLFVLLSSAMCHLPWSLLCSLLYRLFHFLFAWEVCVRLHLLLAACFLIRKWDNSHRTFSVPINRRWYGGPQGAVFAFMCR